MRYLPAAFLLVLSAPALLAQPLDRPLKPLPAAPAAPVTRTDLFIPVGSGDSLDATLFVPAAPPPGAGYPAMVFVHGFGLTKDWDTLSAASWASQGYVALCYSVRAQGRSSGFSSIMGPRERSDLRQVVEFVRSLSGVDSSRVGIQGGSQGGLHALWAVADTLPVRAATADVITPHWASDMFMNGCYRQTLSFLLTTSTVRYDALRDTLWTLLRDDRHDELRERFAAGRDLDTARLHASPVPLVMLLKWQDHYFSAADGIASHTRRRGPSKLYAGTGGHYSDDDPGEWTRQWALIWDWHDRFVRDLPNGVELPPDVIFASSSLPAAGRFAWSHEEITGWPPADLDSIRLYFHATGRLATEPPGTHADSVVVRNDWNGVYSFETGFIEGFQGESFEAAIPLSATVFESDPLLEPMHWVGSPVMSLVLRSEEDRFPLHARIFEVGPDGSAYLVNRVNYTGRGFVPGAERRVQVTGIAHAHRFSAGSRIRIELANIDNQTGPEWGDTPFVLPMFHTTAATVLLDSLRGASITFPIIGETALPVVFAAFSAEPAGPAEVTLRWTTASESNNYGFSVERKETEEFRAIAFLRPQSGPTSLMPLTYSYRDTAAPAGTVWYRIRQMDLDGGAMLSEAVRVEVRPQVHGIPVAAALEQNYPNPFNPSTEVRFVLPEDARVRLEIIDGAGRRVRVLVDGILKAGTHVRTWDAGSHASGVYYARLQVPGRELLRRMMLLR